MSDSRYLARIRDYLGQVMGKTGGSTMGGRLPTEKRYPKNGGSANAPVEEGQTSRIFMDDLPLEAGRRPPHHLLAT